MPRYDYECSTCSHVFELKQSFRDDPVGTCPECQGSARRKFHAVPVIYKGSGFYTTDYARSGVKANGTSGNKAEKDSSDTDSSDTDSSGKDSSDEKKTESKKTEKAATASKTADAKE